MKITLKTGKIIISNNISLYDDKGVIKASFIDIMSNDKYNVFKNDIESIILI